MFMIAGPNGAGKSTLYELRIKTGTKAPFINADIIQREELRDATMEAAYKAAEIAETRRQEHLKQGKSFVSESTFSHPSKLELVRAAKAAGFRVVMYHVNLRSPELSVRRVAQRFKSGGHNVPEDKIRERFKRNPELIRQAVLKSDHAYIYDNSALGKKPTLAIQLKQGIVVRVSTQVPSWARDLYAKELENLSPARLNPAAASFTDAKLIAQKLAGDDAVIGIPDQRKPQIYQGKIVGETALHWVQQTQGNNFIAHFKEGMIGEINLQNHYQVKTTGRDSKAELIQTPSIPVGRKMIASEYAAALQKLGGEGVGRIELPTSHGQYSGEIMQASDTHIVQKIDKNLAIAHDVTNVSNIRMILDHVRAGTIRANTFDIQYTNGRALARSNPLPAPVKGAPARTLAKPAAPALDIKRTIKPQR